jgi:hypothetical protein
MTILKDIQKLVDESGNGFHCKVTSFLKEKDWSTLVSPYYMDNATTKPREIDLIAEKYWRDGGRDFRRGPAAVIIKLFIECKYIPEAVVFWFSDRDVAAATEWVTSNTPLKSKDNKYTRQHHYLASTDKVAKLFASSKMKNPDNEAIYRALNQSLNAMVSLRDSESIIPDIRSGEIPKPASVEMPLILCNSFANFYRVDMDEQTTPQPIEDNFQLEVNYAYRDLQGKHKSEYFLLDIVDFNKFDDYLKALEFDKDAMLAFL